MRTSSAAWVIAATRSMAPSRSQSTGLERPAARPLGRVDLDGLAAEVGRRPAVHHPLVADQAAYGPVGAGRHRYVEPRLARVARERRHRVAQGGEVLVDGQGGRHAANHLTASLSGACGYRPAAANTDSSADRQRGNLK